MSDPRPTVAEPRPAATVLVVRDDPFEVLVMRRPERRGDAYSAALVFPGGVVEPQDRLGAEAPLLADGARFEAQERAVRLAAVREVHEETGLLIAAEGGAPAGPWPAEGLFDALAAAGVRLALERLVPFAHWITPAIAPKRFDTRFFLHRHAGGSELRGGVESTALEWATPAALLAQGQAGDATLVFATRMNLMLLAQSHSGEAAEQAARARPPFTVLPELAQDEEGRRVVRIPEAAGYGVTMGRP